MDTRFALIEALRPNNFLLWTIVAGIALILIAGLLLIPAVRYKLHLAYLHVNGMLDALRLAGRPVALVTLVVTEKYVNLKRRAKLAVARLQRKWFRRRVFLWDAYTHAQHAYLAAATRLDLLREQALDQAAPPPEEYPWISPRWYIPIQLLLGLGDAVLTFLALQLFPIPYLVIVPFVFLIGLVIALVGHCCGQAVRDGKRFSVVIFATGLSLFCIIVGTLRLVYLSQPNSGSGNAVADFLFSYGFPAAFLAASVGVSYQHLSLSPIEDARMKLRAADRAYEAAYRRGKSEADVLLARMNDIVERTLRLCGSYKRGFYFHWRSEPIADTTGDIVLPSAADCWPLQRAERDTLLQAAIPVIANQVDFPKLPTAMKGAV
jgi:hypothetical protein